MKTRKVISLCLFFVNYILFLVYIYVQSISFSISDEYIKENNVFDENGYNSISNFTNNLNLIELLIIIFFIASIIVLFKNKKLMIMYSGIFQGLCIVTSFVFQIIISQYYFNFYQPIFSTLICSAVVGLIMLGKKIYK